MANRRMNQFQWSFLKRPTRIQAKFTVLSSNSAGVTGFTLPGSGGFGAPDSTKTVFGNGIKQIYGYSTAPASGNNVAPGNLSIQLQDNYLSFHGMEYNLSGPPVSVNPLTPTLGVARNYGALANTSITNSGNTVITGSLGLYPGTSVTGFPPGTVSVNQDITNAAAQAAQLAALGAYTDLSTRPATTIASALDGQTLTAGVYKFASGAATLANSAPGTLTFNGSATDVFVVQTASTLTTGAGGAATIALTGGALASNVYFVVGSSATLNTTTGSVHRGNVIANTSITVGLGDVQGSLIALNGAITFSAATTVEIQALAGAAVNVTSGLVLGQLYQIATVGTTTTAAWQTLGVPPGVTPAVGVTFIAATASAGTGTGTVKTEVSSGITSIEIAGDPNLTLQPSQQASGFNGGSGGWIFLNMYKTTTIAQPLDNSIIWLNIDLNSP